MVGDGKLWWWGGGWWLVVGSGGGAVEGVSLSTCQIVTRQQMFSVELIHLCQSDWRDRRKCKQAHDAARAPAHFGWLCPVCQPKGSQEICEAAIADLPALPRYFEKREGDSEPAPITPTGIRG